MTSPARAGTEKSFQSDELDAENELSSNDAVDRPHGPEKVVPEHVWAKLDMIVLPVCTIMYFLSSLDRSNIGNARVAGLQQQLRMSNTQYSMALTVTLIPYILVDLPSNLLLKIVGARVLLPTYVILWGFVCAMQGLVHNYHGLLACRFFLGMFEGGLLPGLSLYLSSFYPRRKLQLRVSIFFSAVSLASAFSGLLAAAILNMDGVHGRPGWAWLFIIEGCFTIGFGLVAYFLLPTSPASAPFLTVQEKQLVGHALKEDGILNMSEKDENYTLANVFHAFRQPHVLIVGVIGFFNGSTLGGLSYFLPSIVVGLGWAGSKAQLMSVPPFAAAAALSVATSFASDRYGARGATIIFFAIVALVGFVVFYASLVNHVRYGALFLLVPGTFCIGPPLGTWAANNSAPQIRRATSLGLLTTMTNLGGVLSTWLLGSLSLPPRYASASITYIVFQVGIVVCAAANLGWLWRENRRKAAARGEGASVGTVVTDDADVRYAYVM